MLDRKPVHDKVTGFYLHLETVHSPALKTRLLSFNGTQSTVVTGFWTAITTVSTTLHNGADWQCSVYEAWGWGDLSSPSVWVWTFGDTQTYLCGFRFLGPLRCWKCKSQAIWDLIGTGLPWLGIRLWGIKCPSKGLSASGAKGFEPTNYSILFCFLHPVRYNGTIHAVAVIGNITLSAFDATRPTAPSSQDPFFQLRSHFALSLVFKRILTTKLPKAILKTARYTWLVQTILQITTRQCHRWRKEILQLIKDTKTRTRKQETEIRQKHLTDKLLFYEKRWSLMALLTMLTGCDGVRVWGCLRFISQPGH